MKTYKGGRGIFMAFFRGRPLRPFGANPDTVGSIAALLLGVPAVNSGAPKCSGLKGSKGGGEL